MCNDRNKIFAATIIAIHTYYYYYLYMDDGYTILYSISGKTFE